MMTGQRSSSFTDSRIVASDSAGSCGPANNSLEPTRPARRWFLRDTSLGLAGRLPHRGAPQISRPLGSLVPSAPREKGPLGCQDHSLSRHLSSFYYSCPVVPPTKISPVPPDRLLPPRARHSRGLFPSQEREEAPPCPPLPAGITKWPWMPNPIE